MSFDEDLKYFQLRKEARTYISRIFEFGAMNFEPLRNVTIVMEGNDQLLLGEVDGALCLRLTGNVRKTQVTALVSIDEKKIKRVTLQTFKSRSDGRIEAFEKHEFSFRADEFERLVAFLSQIKFIDLSNPDNFRIADISTQSGGKPLLMRLIAELLIKSKECLIASEKLFFKACSSPFQERTSIFSWGVGRV